MKTSDAGKGKLALAAAVASAPEGPDRERICWLLEFLRRDVASLRPDELLALRNNVFTYLHEGDLATVDVWDPDELLALGPVPPRRAGVRAHDVVAATGALMASLQDQLRAGIDALYQAGVWRPFAHDRPAPHWSLEKRGDGTIRRSYQGAWSTITLASAVELYLRWRPQLRRCEYEPCRAWFLPTHGRQRSHARCAARARYERFKPTRNYKAEYARRHDSTRLPARRRSRRRP